ncbi:MAG: cysteine peptidase family C39 domain-containing protein [Verrucomicrobiota bacterium]
MRSLSRFCNTLMALFALMLFGCETSLPGRSAEDEDYAFRVKHVDFRYSKVPVIKQSGQRSCGAAALTSLIRYWQEDATITEPELRASYPPDSPTGYPLLQLREIAVDEELLAFAVTLDQNPMKQLSGHLRKGRPVLVAVELPVGRYFAQNLPVIETLDRRTLQVNGWGNQLKAHFLVVMGESHDQLLVMDPQYGHVDVDKVDFERFWKQTGYAALITSAKPQGVTVE